MVPCADKCIESLERRVNFMVISGSKSDDDEMSEEDSKSPISAVYEKAFRHNLHVVFEVIDEHGPPHMRTFVTECRVDQFKTTGEGNSKKVAIDFRE